MRTTRILASGAAALALALSACASYGSEGDAIATDTTESPAPQAAAEAAVKLGETGLGTVLTDATGLTLYGLMDDTDGVPTCDGDCAGTWPPLTVDGAELPPGLDPNLFSVVERSDGTFQLKAGSWPLYRFAGDAAPGETNGQAIDGVWFVAAPDGSLVTGEPAAAPSEPDSSY
jgi:predicted lipoprotein with Yx(FWY)xxD motif